MPADWQIWLADGVVLAGLAWLTLAIVGIIRIPNPYVKVHASAGSVVVGAALILVAALTTGSLTIITRALLVGCFLLLTAPVAGHALAHLEGRLRGELPDADRE